jgi:hypothetical protein
VKKKFLHLLSIVILIGMNACQNPEKKTEDKPAVQPSSITENSTKVTPKTKLYEDVILANGKKKVTVDNFNRAESDYFFKVKVDNGMFGKLVHDRQPASVEKQLVVRINRDTRFSFGVFDLTEPVTIRLPETGDRFQSMLVINEDHYIKKIIYDAGEYTFTKENIGTRYVQVAIRTLVDASSTEDNRKVDTIQDLIEVKQSAPGKFEIPDWDEVSQKRTRERILALADGITNSKGMFGDENEVDPVRHLIGTAAGFGGNAEKDATYLNYNPANNDGTTAFILTVKDVPVDGFWSVSIYNKDGYFEKNPYNSYSFNNLTAKKNDDGSVTIHFGGDPKQSNYLYIMKGWNYTVRLYRPKEQVLNGSWKFPDAEIVK